MIVDGIERRTFAKEPAAGLKGSISR